MVLLMQPADKIILQGVNNNTFFPATLGSNLGMCAVPQNKTCIRNLTLISSIYQKILHQSKKWEKEENKSIIEMFVTYTWKEVHQSARLS